MNNLDAVIQDAVGTCLARLGDNNMSWREGGGDGDVQPVQLQGSLHLPVLPLRGLAEPRLQHLQY